MEGGKLMAEILAQQKVVSIERLPISNFMPPEGVEFRPHAYVTIPAQGASATVVSFTVPRGYNGILNRLANVFVGGGFQEGQGLVSWELFLDFNTAVPAPNFQKIVASLGSVNNPTTLNGIRIKENQLVELVVSNANPGVIPAGQLIGGLLGGYFYPVALEPDNITF
jgi:hypothetical protein